MNPHRADWPAWGGRFMVGRQVSSGLHRRAEAIDKELGLFVRCHDCGAIAQEHHNKHRARFDIDGRMVVPPRDPLPWALARLDTAACEPPGQLALFAGVAR